MLTQPTVIIIGGGMVGLTLAKALVDQQIDVTIVETQQPSLSWQADDLTSRVSALNSASINILKNLHAWNLIGASAKTPMRQMQVWDPLGHGNIEFNATQIRASQLGAIVENRAIIKALWQSLQQHPHATCLCPATPKSIQQTEDAVTLSLDNDTQLQAQFLIGADGANSWVKRQTSIASDTRPYHHDAMTTVIQTAQPHNNTAYQAFLAEGPIGVLPLSNPHHSSVVWSATPTRMKALTSMTTDELNHALTEALDYRLGKACTITPQYRTPLVMRHAKQYCDNHIGLIGDAAHTMHPLAGQGANLGFFDAAVLAQCITAAHTLNNTTPSARVLQRYQRWCRPRNTLMMASMRAFKDMFAETNPMALSTRTFGLTLANATPWLKAQFIHHAMADQGDLPQLATTDNWI